MLGYGERIKQLHLLIILVICMNIKTISNDKGDRRNTPTRFCLSISNRLKGTIKARHKTCFLRPDTGPCRADILQWYFDAKQSKCYRFFWGGCQGNGNRFPTQQECFNYCWLNETNVPRKRPFFCQLTFDYGTCFGHYERWYWDNLYKICKRRIYSGCGGNQNNFETLSECISTCLSFPNNSLDDPPSQLTTCIPLDLPELQKKRKKRDLKYFTTAPYRRKRAHKKKKRRIFPYNM